MYQGTPPWCERPGPAAVPPLPGAAASTAAASRSRPANAFAIDHRDIGDTPGGRGRRCRQPLPFGASPLAKCYTRWPPRRPGRRGRRVTNRSAVRLSPAGPYRRPTRESPTRHRGRPSPGGRGEGEVAGGRPLVVARGRPVGYRPLADPTSMPSLPAGQKRQPGGDRARRHHHYAGGGRGIPLRRPADSRPPARGRLPPHLPGVAFRPAGAPEPVILAPASALPLEWAAD